MTIKQRQALLFYLGYYVGEIDGKWGDLSKTATKAFQKDFGLTADGICGTNTEKALTHAVCYGIAKKTPSTTTSTSQTNNKAGDWWDDIKYFNKKEFACKCGGKYCNGYPAEISKTLVQTAEKVRKHFGKPITVTSGLRCKQHNANSKGVSNSRHMYGTAMDFCVEGKTAAQVLAYVQTLSEIRYSYAIDSKYVHMDVK